MNRLDGRLKRLEAARRAAGPGGCACLWAVLDAAGELPRMCPRCGLAILTAKKAYRGVSPDDWGQE